ncbi:MAG: fimbrial protein [Lachnospiraceae bacterium]|nr:fimbrial protein [Lachnospiraceae bacterium]
MKQRLTKYTTRLLAMLPLLLMLSCTDEFSSPVSENDGDIATLSLVIPRPTLNASRANNESLGEIGKPEVDESKVNSLWFFAFGTDGTATDLATRLQPEGDKLDNDYRVQEVKIPAGKYRIYTVANIDGLNENTTEDQLQELIMEYSTEKMPDPANGLPMVCTPGQVKRSIDEAETAAPKTIEVEKGKNTELYIDLTYLCVKLRYTILFDNSEGGFSHEVFPSQALKITGVRAEGIIDRTSVMSYDTPAGASAFDLAGVDGANCEYPADLDKFLEISWDNLSGTSPTDNNLTPIEESTMDPHKRAYQGIIYLPENRNPEAPTTLIFDAEADNGNQYHYTVVLPPASDKTARPDDSSIADPHQDGMLQRGHFYDIIGRITSIGDQFDIIAGISPWTLQSVAYSLHGPYFLHVEKTSVMVSAGKETLIWYDTDAGDLTFESPERDGKKLFEIKTIEKEGAKYISVTVNPEIAASGEDPFISEFYVIAANLKKRITANPVSLQPYLNVDPQEIEINVGEYISSGLYDGAIDINFSTNLPSVTITKGEGWDYANGNMDLKGELQYSAATGTNQLKFEGLNGGDFWKTERTLTLTYTAKNGTNTETREVKIHIVPNIMDYVIHFRPGTDWGSPHIYVYQCLQLPGDLEQNASKPVGYKFVDNYKFVYFAALEYSFTGKIAFKGWKGYGGVAQNDPSSISLNNTEQGFLIPDDAEEWNPNNENVTNHYYIDMDFCEEYRKTVNCSSCRDNYNKVWPGIEMTKEERGWWKFTLTGIATPGKALIMFADTHNGSTNRYPGNAEVGIPLFDYPSREGWFDFANGKTQFSSEDPNPTIKYLRIYFPKNNDKVYSKHINVWRENEFGTSWENNQGIFDQESGLYYCDFPMLNYWNEYTDISVQLYREGPTSRHQVNKFTDIGNNIRAITINSSNSLVNSGKPKAFESKTYRIYWQPLNDDFNKIHIWSEGGDLHIWNTEEESWTGETEMINNKTYRYYEFKNSIDWNPDKISFIIYNSNRLNNSDPRIRIDNIAATSIESSKKYTAN